MAVEEIGGWRMVAECGSRLQIASCDCSITTSVDKISLFTPATLLCLALPFRVSVALVTTPERMILISLIIVLSVLTLPTSIIV